MVQSILYLGLRSTKTPAVFVGLVVALLSYATADQIVMKNGDRLSGTILTSDQKKLILKTTYAGEIAVQWNEVQEITSTQDLHVSLKDGRTVVGQVSTADGNLNVSTKASGRVEAAKESVAFLRNDTEEAAQITSPQLN